MTWSNFFPGQPLTAENVAATLSELMRGQPVAMQPDRLVVPVHVIIDYYSAEVRHFERLVSRAEKRIAAALTSTRYGQRRRQIAQGVKASRALLRDRAKTMLPRWHADLAHFRSELAQAMLSSERN